MKGNQLKQITMSQIQYDKDVAKVTDLNFLVILKMNELTK